MFKLFNNNCCWATARLTCCIQQNNKNMNVQCSLLLLFLCNLLDASASCHCSSPPGSERWCSWVKLGLRVGLDHLHRQLQRVKLLHCSLVLPLPTLSLAALTIPSRPTIRFCTIPSFYVLRFRDSSLMIITSLTDGCGVCSPPQRRCRSRRPRRYSLVHLDHTASLQRRGYLTLDSRSVSWI